MLAPLLRSAAAGNDAAWDALVARLTPMIRGVARRHRLCADDVEDVVQVTWVLLFEHIDAVRDPERLPGWLATTAQRESLRLRSRAIRFVPFDDDAHDRPAAPPPCPAEAGERRREIEGALRRLPPRQRELIHALLAEDEPNYADVAARLGIPLGSVGPTRIRSLARLRRDAGLLALAG